MSAIRNPVHHDHARLSFQPRHNERGAGIAGRDDRFPQCFQFRFHAALLHLQPPDPMFAAKRFKLFLIERQHLADLERVDAVSVTWTSDVR